MNAEVLGPKPLGLKALASEIGVPHVTFSLQRYCVGRSVLLMMLEKTIFRILDI